MGKITFKQPPGAGDMRQVTVFVIAPGKARKDSNDLGVTLRPQNGIGGGKFIRIDIWKSREIAGHHGGSQGRRNIAASTLPSPSRFPDSRARVRSGEKKVCTMPIANTMPVSRSSTLGVS